MLHVNLEGFSVCGALKTRRFSHPMEAHRSDQRQVLASVSGHLAVGPYSPLGARERSRSIEVCVPLSSLRTQGASRRSEKLAIATEPSLPRGAF
jgi:hypothetical protein